MKSIKKYIKEKLTISKKLIKYNTTHFKTINELLKKYDGKLLSYNSNDFDYYYECFIPKINDLVDFLNKHKSNLLQCHNDIKNDLFDAHDISLVIDDPSYGVVFHILHGRDSKHVTNIDSERIGYLTFRHTQQKVNTRIFLVKNLNEVDIDDSFMFSCIDYLLEKYV